MPDRYNTKAAAILGACLLIALAVLVTVLVETIGFAR